MNIVTLVCKRSTNVINEHYFDYLVNQFQNNCNPPYLQIYIMALLHERDNVYNTVLVNIIYVMYNVIIKSYK